ncbi:hypothetical protein ACWIEX_09925 [Bosea sp. NPDC055353]
MTSRFQIVGFLFATLTLSGVALAQQGGGGGNGGGSGGGGSGGQGGQGGDHNSVIAIRLQDHERVRVPGAAKTRAAGANCITHACNEPPRYAPPPVQTAEGCGGELRIARDRNGRIVRRVCEYPN